MRVLGVVPNDRLDDYEAAGIGGWLAGYYNPEGYFDQVYCLSPLESREEERYGLHVLPTRKRQLPTRVRTLGVQVLRAYGGGWAADVVSAARGCGIPLMASVHTSAPAALSTGIRSVDLVLCTSRIVADVVCAHGVSESRVRILPNRVDRTRFCPHPLDPEISQLRARFPWRHPILHVGRYAREKNLDTLIDALTLLGPDYGLLAVGSGDPAPWRDQAARLGLGSRCELLGPVPNQELPSYYRWCACMCVPSRWEGFGIVFIEAMACGATIVTSSIAPMNEYIRDGVNGVLVPAFEDASALAAGVVRACEGAARGGISAAARESTAPFSLETVNRLEVGLYQEALALERPSAAPRWRQWLPRALPW